VKIAISAINKIYRTLAINGIIGFLGFFSPRFYSLDAAAEKADQVAVLQLGDQDHLVYELIQALHAVLR
jgi:hypothetical protein